jgi:hypothetical protein
LTSGADPVFSRKKNADARKEGSRVSGGDMRPMRRKKKKKRRRGREDRGGRLSKRKL